MTKLRLALEDELGCADVGALVCAPIQRSAGGFPVTFEYYVGVHHPHWLERSGPPLFVSRRSLARYKGRLPRARGRWALDSGGFTELSERGSWSITAVEYASEVRRYAAEIGGLVFAAAQDWMCEPPVLAKTGSTEEQHQERSIDNYIELMSIAPELPWMPTLQGWCRYSHVRHLDRYFERGVDLTKLARVGVGSICRRPKLASTVLILSMLASSGLDGRLHGFGLKVQALKIAAPYLASADSLAWSFGSRRRKLAKEPGWQFEQPNAIETAVDWYESKIEPIQRTTAHRFQRRMD